jgi:hypothetical protein
MAFKKIAYEKAALIWMDSFSESVRNRDIHNAKSLFSTSVISFGTRVTKAPDLETLITEQWYPTWERTAEFAIVRESISIEPSNDYSVLIISFLWSSIGVDTPTSWDIQKPYAREGRGTLILKLDHNSSYICTHSHFSLNPNSEIKK